VYEKDRRVKKKGEERDSKIKVLLIVKKCDKGTKSKNKPYIHIVEHNIKAKKGKWAFARRSPKLKNPTIILSKT